MFRNKLCLLFCLLLPWASAFAQSPNLVSEEMIQTEAVNYAKTAVVELGEFKREYNASATEFYPYTIVLSTEAANASFLQYHVARHQQVKQGEILATFTLEIDEAAAASARLSLERAQTEYEAGRLEKERALAEMLKQQNAAGNEAELELMLLRIRRAQVAYEQYCYQQECSIERLAQELTELEEANSRSHLYAPFDGTVTSLTYKREGEKIYAGEELVTMYREDGMLLRISNDQLFFRYGMPVTVTSGPKSNLQTFAGQVVSADNILPQNRRQGYAFIQLEPFENEEKPRLSRLTVTGTSQLVKNIMLIPRRAAKLDGGKYYVNCLINGSLQKRCINPGIVGMSQLWVLQGLNVGDTVVID